MDNDQSPSPSKRKRPRNPSKKPQKRRHSSSSDSLSDSVSSKGAVKSSRKRRPVEMAEAGGVEHVSSSSQADEKATTVIPPVRRRAVRSSPIRAPSPSPPPKHGKLSPLMKTREKKKFRTSLPAKAADRTQQPELQSPKYLAFTLFFTDKFIFSNHYICPQLHIDGQDFNCTEQYYMWRKAKMFTDEEMANAILACNNPKNIKKLGSRVRDFDETVWNRKCRDVMMLANYRKYQQNAELRHELLRTMGTELVECNPTDCRWGVGLAMNDNRVFDSRNWRGENWLGKILTKIRDRFMTEEKYADEVRQVKAELQGEARRRDAEYGLM